MGKSTVSDWNGTLFRLSTAEGLNREIGHSLLDDARSAVFRGRFWRILDMVKLLRARNLVERRLREHKDGIRPLQDVYDLFNETVIRGLPPHFMQDSAIRYAAKTHEQVNRDIAKPIWNAKREDGRFVGILSVAYDYSIQSTLRFAGFAELPDYIFANRLVEDKDGNARYLTLDVYGRKGEVMEEEFFRAKGLRPDTTLYIGDSLDDEPVAEMLPEGHFIVSFSADGRFRDRMVNRYGAFVPESRDDLQDYLRRK